MADHRPLLCVKCGAPMSVKEKRKPGQLCDLCRRITDAVERLIAHSNE